MANNLVLQPVPPRINRMQSQQSSSLESPQTPPSSLIANNNLLTCFPAFSSADFPPPPSPYAFSKISIHHQDAEVSIADATDCLRMVSGKINWFHRKQCFCPDLIAMDDVEQIAALHRRILIEEVPFLELQNRLRDGLVVDIPRELEGRVQMVCKLFTELKSRIDDLATHVKPKVVTVPELSQLAAVNTKN